ncbi:hypothetical protein [Exiguobacterium sp. s192]|uniref:hypothetical protein n=1 Tax=Exiguobacterium sp. s192 TaxID=2751206 RepID=UPI001BE6E799|nr:hypothetical protein [Exiguobacterium sp. s192]
MIERQLKEMTLVMHGTRTEVTAFWNEEQNKYLVFPNKDIEEIINLKKYAKKPQQSS